MTHDVRPILASLCAPVLGGVDCAFLGGSHLLLAAGRVPPEVTLAERFGAILRAEVCATTTHLLVPPSILVPAAASAPSFADGFAPIAPCERTHALLEQARALGLLGSVEIVDSRWLLDSLSRWARQPEAPYRLPLEAVQAPDDDGE